MPKYYNEITKEIVDYPEDAAAIFDVLKRVPSERENEVVVDGNQLTIEVDNTPEPDVDDRLVVVDVEPIENGNKNAK